MPRPIKYQNADDLLDNCTVKDDCYLWPQSSTPMPMLSPNSPLARRFGTTSVMRILFTICRFVPAGPRLVHRCSNPFCVNPFHFAESKAVRAKRLELSNPNGLLPEQEERRHLIAPPDEELIALRPKNPTHIKILLDAAVLAGYDAKGMHDSRSYKVPTKAQPRFAEPDVPVLIIKPRIVPAQGGAEDDELWDEDALPAPVQPAVVDESTDNPQPETVHEGEAGDDIFDLIRRGRSAMAGKN
jgi:hypothetical protein